MEILVTSGGTSEKIDRVRSITNHSSGKLGKIITETLLKAGHEVCLITTLQAVKPVSHPNLTIIEIKNTADLLQVMKDKVMDYQVLIHSMAVSDYTPVYMTGFNEVKDSQDLTEFLDKKNQETKISSKEDVQVLFLKKNPKIISLVKEWNSKIHLIGFKLLVDVSREYLIQIARESLEKNKADIIVANDLTQINAEQHIAYLVEKANFQTAMSKHEIADLLLEKINSYD
ncbi:phosphopantothenate--cysteine ligase [Streptococcus infantis]|uniref:phosphopantothenate--cysteine ligase n=1 Tax=Streptococcus infantis TaxID=68892 RepID=UPI001CC18AE5|nr:phosphopantothenate--cysteine ligase [Streptococcus infantis]MBZ2119253.1 phosphopantothenate--cysteine ligase [Streptococcus infantis]MBZ2121375.1 phosphopantothenate--cysteine ligase [Streptococcus infantis]MBZ2125149.1 phosphopantothenate--cysteine ligase [Streptococcus infantis]